MTLYVLRHASAGQHRISPKSDEKRPLDEQGERQSVEMGRALAALQVEVDVVISSPLTRALQTAELAAKEFGYAEKIVTDDALRPEAAYDQFREVLARYTKKESIMVVGHNPSLSNFLVHLLTESEECECVDLKKGAVAKLELDGGDAKLEWLLTPKLVRALQTDSAKSSRPKTSRK
jgi:phosphohistidine phosphatase